ncbi:MAG: AmmeMemoRadiSam system protein B [Deltaproteobacteria bacterium]|nr:AmmeMemoRadiSam system protein B [Deltaproteobacteria bacterium]
MSDPYRYPKLRYPVDMRLERLEGQEVLLLTCPLGIAPTPLCLVPAVGPIIAAFEGHRSIDEITQQFSPYGIKQELIRELAALLDKHLFLAGPNFAAAEQSQKNTFRTSTTRPAALAGSGYPSIPEELAREIDGYLSIPQQQISVASGKMLGLVSPHIDYRRGGVAYGITYNQLRGEDHDLYIVIGTSHQYSKRKFHLTRKNFPTPLGVLPTDHEFVDGLALRYGIERSYADEFLHRREHSLELQLPFIHRITTRPRMVPILVGGFHEMVLAGKYPEQFEEYDAFASALTEGLKERLGTGQRICIIAGVDMAHVGQSFGDEKKLTPEFMEEVRRRDLQYLDTIKERAKHRMFAHIAEDEDARRICGFPTMYTVLDVLERLGIPFETRQFDYRQAVDYQRECAVTFAGLGLYLPHAAS